ncbi:MAG: dihydroorotase, partial [Duncaniella sp.]|nr:dihydroorotase [Duncaniella sp.]
YYADLVVVDPEAGAPKVTDAEVLSRCGWTPLAGMSLPARVELTMVNGTVVYEAGGEPEGGAAMPITFGAFRPD